MAKAKRKTAEIIPLNTKRKAAKKTVKRWTKQEVKRLKDGVAAKEAFADIAADLGRSLQSVYIKNLSLKKKAANKPAKSGPRQTKKANREDMTLVVLERLVQAVEKLADRVTALEGGSVSSRPVMFADEKAKLAALPANGSFFIPARKGVTTPSVRSAMYAFARKNGMKIRSVEMPSGMTVIREK